MQSFTNIVGGDLIKDSRALLMNNDTTIMSGFEGTAFPTTNLVIGMRCYRSDEKKEYQLTATDPAAVWVLTKDLNKALINLEDAEANYLRKDDDLSSIADAAAARTNLGLGSVATENVVPVAKGGTGGGDAASARANLGLGDVAVEDVLPVALGGTGATDAATARSNLGLVIGTNVLAPNGNGSALTSLNASAISSGTVPDANLPTNARGSRTVGSGPPSGGADGDTYWVV